MVRQHRAAEEKKAKVGCFLFDIVAAIVVVVAVAVASLKMLLLLPR